MKTCTLLGRSLLLVAMLAVSWAAAVPLQGDTHTLQDIHSEEQLHAYLENNPSVVSELYPDLLREASEVLVVVDPARLVEMLREQEAAVAQETHEEWEYQEEEGMQEDQEKEHDRRKRQLDGFGMIPWPYGRDYSANVGYQRHFNKGRSSLGVNAPRNWGASGRFHVFRTSFLRRPRH